jgi:ribosomal-protein-alanine N-acetyltransferase
MDSIKIKTSRLDLIAGTLELATLEMSNLEQLSQLLEVETPEDWPPPLNDDESQSYFHNFLKENPNAVGWTVWFITLRSEGKNKNKLIGNGGFKGKPGVNGTVEIGYSILEPYQRNGYATEAVQGLAEWAFSVGEVNCIIAETFPDLHASIRVLEKNGFGFIGQGSEEGTIRYELGRKNFLNP